nr:hypothetical protein [Tanacetum cinerariifolium]
MRPVPPSPDRTPTLYIYPLNSGDDSLDEDLSDTAKSLYTQSALTSVVHTSPAQSLPTSLVLANQPKKGIPMPLGYRVDMNRWRVAPSSTSIYYFHQSYHLHLVKGVMILPWMKSHIHFISCDHQEKMTNTNQRMSFVEVEKIIAQRVANSIETIAIYETKTLMAHESMNQINQQEERIAKNTSSKWKPSNKEGYAGNLPLCNKCMFHHNGPCGAKYGNCKRFAHQNRYRRTLVLREKQSPSVAKQKAKVTCYECGILGHYKSKCPKWKFQKRVNEYWKEKALRDSSVVANNVDI